MQDITLHDATLRVADEGSGPPLLLVHGFPLDHTMWRHQIDHFKATHRVIAPDLRGLGESSITPGMVTMKQYADDLAALLPQLGENRPVILCGLSMGGYVAWQFVEHHRSRLAALILCDTKAAADTSQARQSRLESAAKVERDGTSILLSAMLPKLFGEEVASSRTPVVEETAAMILRNDPRGCAAAQRGMAERVDYRPRLASINVPTLVLCGEHDLISPPAEMREIAAAIPGAKYAEIPAASHMAPLQFPQQVNAELEKFLASLT
jgi:pimeloyl-ACP methyl ester carboxylesterase